ncbi:MlaC/ttg2D family ABC transporter substrate-binding protein [Primorskyibacter marinus]|uniref:MlaC/ttg2D family ABC transporter substrate-binding protein n=1 Tax=Primorskyibacter marinus TaxID=1977320 RepID=UPI001E2DA210|nr:ABC transporter substrate-binding protein [Primorskyibacter marinus]
MFHNERMNRRNLIGGLAAGVMLLPVPALSLTDAGARRLVDSLVGEINRVIGSGQSESAMIRAFERIFDRYADVPTIARYALGVDARSASAAQMRSFTDAFKGYIARKYGKRFREFVGGRIEVESVFVEKTYHVVRSTAFLRGEAPFIIDFMVSDRSGRDLFFNMKVEGVNMLLTERTEIGAMLDRRRGDIDAMTADLRRAG